MVVLDAVLRSQAEQANEILRCAGTATPASAGIPARPEINGMPNAHVHYAHEHLRPTRHHVERSNAFPSIREPGHRRCVEETSRSKAHQSRFNRGRPTPPTGTWRMQQEDIERVQEFPQVHRVLLVPGRLPRAARPPQARRVHRAPRFSCTAAALESIRSTSRIASTI